jgi:hypothetical protein
MNRVSGKALVQHTRRSDLASFEFIDGFGAAVQLTWEIGGDMIPTTYDTDRVERIIGIDGVEKMEKLNQPGESGGDIINDLKKGLYDCTVTIGPSYQTARQEALATLMDAGDKFPIVNQLMTDLILKNLDVTEVDEMVRRARIPLIQQGIVQPSQQEQSQLPPPKQPDPMQVAELQRQQALARRDGAQADKVEAEVKLGPLNDHERILEIAGKHLANLVLAQKLGQPNAASQAEDSQGSQPRTA